MNNKTFDVYIDGSSIQVAIKDLQAALDSAVKESLIVQKVGYTELLETSIKSKDERNAQLQLDNAKLRKALEVCKYDCNTGEVIGIAKEALSTASHSCRSDGVCKCERPTQEPVYRNGDRTMTMEDRNFTSEGDGYIQDNNFDFDAGLRIDGDFVDAERDQYAQMLCNALNARQEVKKSLAVQKPDRTGMVYCRNETCKAENADSIDCICWSPESQPESVVLNNQTTQKHTCRYSRSMQSHPRKCLDCNEAESQQKPLSDEAINSIVKEHYNWFAFARAIEKAHGIGE
jgi:hypothetical protein